MSLIASPNLPSDAARPDRRMLSIVMPAHNEQEVIADTCRRTIAACEALAWRGLGFEIVFVNDGSRDRTPELLDELAAADPRVRAVHLTRNFGHQPAVSAGLTVARGDVVAIMDADLQDPPEVLGTLLDQWDAGYQVVYAVRKKRKEGPFKRFAYWAFYRLLASISDIDMPLDSGDFCLMDRSAVDLLNSLPEKQRFVRGLRTWIGLKQIGVEYERSARAAGTPSYTFKSLLKLATDGLVSFSVLPLRFTTRLGLFGVVASILLGLWVVLATLLDIETPRGWASLACLVLLMSSIQLISLGIIGEYLARVFLEVKGRPTFLIARITQAASSHPLPLGEGGASASRERVHWAARDGSKHPHPNPLPGGEGVTPSVSAEVSA